MIRKILLGVMYAACIAPVLATILILVMYIQVRWDAGSSNLPMIQPAFDPNYRIIWDLIGWMLAPSVFGSPMFVIAIFLKWRKLINIHNAYLIIFAIGSIFFILWLWCDLFGLRTVLVD